MSPSDLLDQLPSKSDFRESTFRSSWFRWMLHSSCFPWSNKTTSKFRMSWNHPESLTKPIPYHAINCSCCRLIPSDIPIVTTRRRHVLQSTTSQNGSRKRPLGSHPCICTSVLPARMTTPLESPFPRRVQLKRGAVASYPSYYITALKEGESSTAVECQ